VLTASRDAPAEVTEEALLAVVGAVRDAGCPVVVDLPRGAAAGAVLADADLSVLVVPARLRAACAARALIDDPASVWGGARIVLRRVPGGLAGKDVADVVGRPVTAEMDHDRGAPGRGERGEPPGVSARSPWGRLSRQLLALVSDGAVR